MPMGGDEEGAERRSGQTWDEREAFLLYYTITTAGADRVNMSRLAKSLEGAKKGRRIVSGALFFSKDMRLIRRAPWHISEQPH
jgi:hypothetical protein